MGVGDCLGGMCSCVGGCCRAACKIGTPKQRLMTAWFVLLCVEAAYGICASTTTTNLNTYIETLAVDLQPSIQLLAANCVAGIILCCLHFIVSATFLLGRACSKQPPGTVFGSLLVMTFYTFLVLFSLAGALAVVDKEMETKVGSVWTQTHEDMYKLAYGLLYAAGACHLVFAIVLYLARSVLFPAQPADGFSHSPRPAADVEMADGGGGFFSRMRGRPEDTMVAPSAMAPMPAAPKLASNPLFGGGAPPSPPAPPPRARAAGGDNPFGDSGAASNPWGGPSAGGARMWGDAGAGASRGAALYGVSRGER